MAVSSHVGPHIASATSTGHHAWPRRPCGQRNESCVCCNERTAAVHDAVPSLNCVAAQPHSKLTAMSPLAKTAMSPIWPVTPSITHRNSGTSAMLPTVKFLICHKPCRQLHADRRRELRQCNCVYAVMTSPDPPNQQTWHTMLCEAGKHGRLVPRILNLQQCMVLSVVERVLLQKILHRIAATHSITVDIDIGRWAGCLAVTLLPARVCMINSHWLALILILC